MGEGKGGVRGGGGKDFQFRDPASPVTTETRDTVCSSFITQGKKKEESKGKKKKEKNLSGQRQLGGGYFGLEVASSHPPPLLPAYPLSSHLSAARIALQSCSLRRDDTGLAGPFFLTRSRAKQQLLWRQPMTGDRFSLSRAQLLPLPSLGKRNEESEWRDHHCGRQLIYGPTVDKGRRSGGLSEGPTSRRKHFVGKLGTGWERYVSSQFWRPAAFPCSFPTWRLCGRRGLAAVNERWRY